MRPFHFSFTNFYEKVIGPLAADIVGLKELSAFLSIAWLSVVLPTVCKVSEFKVLFRS
jgi:hypothetical protein